VTSYAYPRRAHLGRQPRSMYAMGNRDFLIVSMFPCSRYYRINVTGGSQTHDFDWILSLFRSQKLHQVLPLLRWNCWTLNMPKRYNWPLFCQPGIRLGSTAALGRANTHYIFLHTILWQKYKKTLWLIPWVEFCWSLKSMEKNYQYLFIANEGLPFRICIAENKFKNICS